MKQKENQRTAAKIKTQDYKSWAQLEPLHYTLPQNRLTNSIITAFRQFPYAIKCDWFAWCSSLLWFYYYYWMISASLNYCQKMGAEPGRRFLKQLAKKLEPVIVANQNSFTSTWRKINVI